MKLFLATTTTTFFLLSPLSCHLATAGYCNWGPLGTAESSICNGKVQGGPWCNKNQQQCESCNGRWCTNDQPSMNDCPDGWEPASWTWYQSFAPCCEDSPNYDPNADTTECDLYNACAWTGQFAYIGKRSYNYVKTSDLVSFFSTYGDNNSFGRKRILVLTDSGQAVVNVLVADTCGDADCNGCCTANAQPSGYLIDMEAHTVVRHFGSLDAAHGQVCWKMAPEPVCVNDKGYRDTGCGQDGSKKVCVLDNGKEPRKFMPGDKCVVCRNTKPYGTKDRGCTKKKKNCVTSSGKTPPTGKPGDKCVA